jgi:hypothetical protein
MAVCIKIAAPTAEGVVEAVAKNDRLLQILTYREPGMPLQAMNVGDDYYTAPYALVPLTRPPSRTVPRPDLEYYMVFTCYKVRDPHDQAIRAMGRGGAGIHAISSTRGIECGELLRAKVSRDQWTIFREECWANGKDVCKQLEDFAVKAACAALGVEPPADWRAIRAAKLSQMPGPRFIIDVPLPTLPEWGTVPFPPKTAPERAAAEREAQLLISEREEAEAEKKRERDDLEQFQANKRARYLPALAKAAELSDLPDGNGCIVVFETGPGGEPGPFQCPYDRKNDCSYCAGCQEMKEKLTF